MNVSSVTQIQIMCSGWKCACVGVSYTTSVGLFRVVGRNVFFIIREVIYITENTNVGHKSHLQNLYKALSNSRHLCTSHQHNASLGIRFYSANWQPSPDHTVEPPHSLHISLTEDYCHAVSHISQQSQTSDESYYILFSDLLNWEIKS